MKELLEKISSYNLFNYLLPGIVFSVLAEEITDYSFIHDEILIAAFVFYFIGLVISRLGSIILQPILQKSGFLKFADYKDFIEASKKDEKIELFSEINNSYRTYCSLFLCVLLLKIFESLALKYELVAGVAPYLLITGLLILFIFSYKKQTQFVVKRIKHII